MRKGVCNVDQIDGFLQALKRVCQNGSLQTTLHLVYHTDQSGFSISTKVFSCLLQACTLHKDLHTGRDIYSWILRSGFHNVFLANQLIRMFASFGSLLEANQVFNNFSKPNVFTWTLIILAHADSGHDEHAISLYHRMQAVPSRNSKPDPHLFVAVLKACTNLGNLAQSRLIHADIKQSGLESCIFVANSLINMYAKCGCLLDAQTLFRRLPERDAVTWGAIISAYVQHGQGEEALKHFAQMRKEGITPNRVTFICALKACFSDMVMNQGKCIHKDILECGLEADKLLGNTLVDMYVKCGSFGDALGVFQRLPNRDKVAWSVMVEACDQEGRSEEAFHIYQQMQEEGVELDRVNFVNILKVCSSTAALQQGKLIHDHITQVGLDSDAFICNTLIDMYAKCGSFADACKLFICLPRQDIAAWNAMISGCAHCSDMMQVSQCWDELGPLKPNIVTNINFLSACSHAGLINKGLDHFNTLNGSALSTCVDHHNCIVNLLGSAGQLKDAEYLLQTMPIGHHNIVGRHSLLSHCKNHGSLEDGQGCFTT